MQELTSAEELMINQYAASELAGAVIMGRMSRKTADPYLRRKFAWHCAEEARHAVVWYDLIERLDIHSMDLHDKEGYFSLIERAESVVEFLAFVHVYELRVPFHFAVHMEWTQHPEIRRVLQGLIREESAHIEWIRGYLQRHPGRADVEAALKKFSEFESAAYARDLSKIPDERFIAMVREKLPAFERLKHDQISL